MQVKKIALTGGIGSGKSTVAKILQRFGYCVIDADVLAREVLFQKEIAEQVKTLFHENIFNESGVLNRDRVRELILENPDYKHGLEKILHPAIAASFEKKALSLEEISPSAWIFYEAALILENKIQDKFSACVVVRSEEHIKKQRLLASRDLPEAHIEKIMQLQMPDAEKIKYADFVLENSTIITKTEEQVLRLINFLYQKFS